MGDIETEKNLPQHNTINSVSFSSILSYNLKKLINNTFMISMFLIPCFDSDLPQMLNEIRLQLLQPETQKGYDFFVSKVRTYS